MDQIPDIAPKRRSRMQRQSTGKRLELSPRDLDIFRLLNRYRFLRSTFIHAFVGGNKTKLLERLGHLYHEGGFLNRPAQQWQSVNARYQPAIYETTPRAEEVLRAHGLLDNSNDMAAGKSAHRQFAHSLMICDILASLELGTRHDPILRFIGWPEILAKAPEATRHRERPLQIPVSISHVLPNGKAIGQPDFKLVADALFGLEYRSGSAKSYRFFALEADRDTMPVARSNLEQSSYLRKFLGYRQMVAEKVYKSHFGLPNLLILSVTVSKVHQRHMMDALQDLGGGSAFLFKTMPSFASFERAPEPTPRMLQEPWLRVGHEPLCIDRP